VNLLVSEQYMEAVGCSKRRWILPDCTVSQSINR